MTDIPPAPPIRKRKFVVLPPEDLAVLVKHSGYYSNLRRQVNSGECFFMVEVLMTVNKDRRLAYETYGDIIAVDRDAFWIRVAARIPIDLRDRMVFNPSSDGMPF
ncbi:hypothetical protein BH765_gp83 [Gordonia phage Kvothe]|uniref:Uncharacterized protein n=1 Tax=Gordonia phage Kvothe TaxID=1838071 RepID=A0A160DEA9_9CAUD|nr:hypothetical protein BH765_gp83 [Gordonia phage Kvothe]ANA86145.1 hypothetical protein PBI_KVOTHE_83 [Gordonia phage Kvothe]UJD20718.1 hypothetical protein SEA_NIAGARA_83 [Gordonia phage Niagara]UYL87101.1 hypothetical protein SEA_HOLLOW_83 [Gordonia phage Hollow]